MQCGLWTRGEGNQHEGVNFDRDRLTFCLRARERNISGSSNPSGSKIFGRRPRCASDEQKCEDEPAPRARRRKREGGLKGREMVHRVC